MGSAGEQEEIEEGLADKEDTAPVGRLAERGEHPPHAVQTVRHAPVGRLTEEDHLITQTHLQSSRQPATDHDPGGVGGVQPASFGHPFVDER